MATMSTSWKFCSVWALRMLQSQRKALYSPPLYIVETSYRSFGISRGWLTGNRYSSLAAQQVDVDDRESNVGFLTTLGLKGEKLTRLVEKHPLVISREFKNGFLSLVDALENHGVSEQLISRILVKNPQLILRILERDLYNENLAT